MGFPRARPVEPTQHRWRGERRSDLPASSSCLIGGESFHLVPGGRWLGLPRRFRRSSVKQVGDRLLVLPIMALLRAWGSTRGAGTCSLSNTAAVSAARPFANEVSWCPDHQPEGLCRSGRTVRAILLRVVKLTMACAGVVGPLFSCRSRSTTKAHAGRGIGEFRCDGCPWHFRETMTRLVSQSSMGVAAAVPFSSARFELMVFGNISRFQSTYST